MPRRYVPRALRGQVAGKKDGRPAADEPRTPPRPLVRSEPLADPTAATKSTEAVTHPAAPTTLSEPAGTVDDPPRVRPAAPTRRRPSPRPHPVPAPSEPSNTEPGANGAEADLADVGPDVSSAPAKRPAKAPVKAPARPSSGGRRPAARTRGKSGTAGKPTTKPKAERARLAAKRRATEQRRRQQLRVASLVLALVFVLGAASAALTGWRSVSHDSLGTASDEAMSAADSATPALLSYDYRHFDASVDRASQYISGTFAKDYRRNMAALKKQAVKLKAQVTAKVTATSVVSAGHDTVVLLIFVDQYRKNTNISETKVDQDRVVLTMKHQDNGWKVAKLIAV